MAEAAQRPLRAAGRGRGDRGLLRHGGADPLRGPDRRGSARDPSGRPCGSGEGLASGHGSRRGQRASEAETRLDPLGGGGPRYLPCPLDGGEAPLPLPHSQPPLPARPRGEQGLARALEPRRRPHASRGAGPRGAARLHHLPRRRVPGEQPRAHPGQARRGARGGGGPGPCLGTLLPAPSGAVHGRHPGESRRRALERRRGPGGARRPRPRPVRAAGALGGALPRRGGLRLSR